MFLVFNKQYRQEEKLFRELKNKIKKSKSMVGGSSNKLGEFYKLDSIDIHFFVTSERKLKVFDKSYAAIVEISADIKGYPNSDEYELSNARFHMFSNLLSFARNNYQKRIEKDKMNQATKKLQEKKAKLDKAAKDKAEAEAVIANATNRLKSL